MDYQQTVHSFQNQPEALEKLYLTAQNSHEVAQFTQAIDVQYTESPQSLLYAAWHYRLQYAAQRLLEERPSTNWALVLPLSLLTGLALWLISDMNAFFLDHIPYVLLFWSPIAALFVLVFFAIALRKNVGRYMLAAVGIALAGAYVWLMATRMSAPDQVLNMSGRMSITDQYLDLMAFHLPLLAWAAVAIGILGIVAAYRERFAFLSKSVEIFVTGGVYAVVVIMFFGLTMTMFQVLDVNIDELYQRLLVFGIGGAIPLLAIAGVYDPLRMPSEQQFSRGLGRVVPTLMRLLLPLTLLILLIYVLAIPFNFMEAFENREALIVYNIMQFAVLGLLLGVTPVFRDDLSESFQKWLRRGIIILLFLTLLISLYALAAIVYRTLQDVVTINRLAFIGWNLINIGAFVLFLLRQWRYSRSRWLEGVQSTFSITAVAYVIWALFILLVVPWLF